MRRRTVEDAVLLRVFSAKVLREEHRCGRLGAGEVLRPAEKALTGVRGDVCKSKRVASV
jgi:hypothetical protein